MSIPNLAGVIKKDDIYQKGGGSFKASYIAWAKTSQLLREHAPGWYFYLASQDGNYVWEAPDGTGYLMCYFGEEEHGNMPLFPFPIMDNRNMPIKLEKISSRALTDSHRRALCACAAFTFGLAYELWADEEITEIKKEEGEKVDVQPECQLKPPVTKKKQSTSKTDLVAEVVGFIQTKFKTQEEQIAWVADKATQFDLSGEGSKLSQMTIGQLKTCIEELKTII